MNIILPSKKVKAAKPLTLVQPHSVIIIGANGSGKSRFVREIETQHPGLTFRLSAFNAISLFPDISEGEQNSVNTLYTHYCGYQEGRHLYGIERISQLLLNSTLPGRENITKKSCSVWSNLFSYASIRPHHDTFEVVPHDGQEPYPAERLSRGEKVAFYLIAATQMAPRRGCIIVQEPELYLHRSILPSFWDQIERLRPDCIFIYLTHDIEFAYSRYEAVRIWIKKFDATHNTWDYERIDKHENFPEELSMELLGSRKPILFVEGDHRSIDGKLYPYIFPEFFIKPLGGCSQVIEATRAFSEMKELHHLNSWGIVDRDRRTQHEINILRERNILIPNVAEVENMLMLEPVVRAVARRMLHDERAVFEEVKERLSSLFEKEVSSQALLHTRHQLRRQIEYMIDKRLTSIEDLAYHIEHLTDDIDTVGLYNRLCELFDNYARKDSYSNILRVYNQKSMLSDSHVTSLCGLANKDKYLQCILNILKENKRDAQIIREAIRGCFDLDYPTRKKNKLPKK